MVVGEVDHPPWRTTPSSFQTSATRPSAETERELADLARRNLSGDKLSGDFLARRRFVEVIYVPIGIVLAPCFMGLGQAALGIALGVGTIGLFAWLSSRRVARVSVSSDGVFSLPGRL